MMRFQTLNQTSWDWRAAGNFIFGGAGSALLVLAIVLHGASTPPVLVSLVSLALIGAGLALVWLEIGRPWRAFNVFFHPETSWMTREGMVATVTFACMGLVLLVNMESVRFAALVSAAAFLYCQGRILRQARGIPAWRENSMVSLIIWTGLVEGAALMTLMLPLVAVEPVPAWVFIALLLARALTWFIYREKLLDENEPTPGRTRRVISGLNREVLVLGTALPALLLLASLFAQSIGIALASIAALAALGAGWWMKFSIVTRAAQVQGFAFGKLKRGHPLGLRPGKTT